MRNVNRRDFLRVAGLSSIALTQKGFATVDKVQRPNLLIIHTDEHNFRTLGCYRKTLTEDQAKVWGTEATVDTPNIDWIADNGAMCTRFYGTTPVCYMVSIPDPHGPDSVRQPYSDAYRQVPFETPRTAHKDLGDVPSWARPKGGRTKMSQYFGIELEKDPDELMNVCGHPEYRKIRGTLAQEVLAYGKRFQDRRISSPGIAKDLAALVG